MSKYIYLVPLFPLIGFLLLWAQTSVVNKSIGSESISYIVNPSLTIAANALRTGHHLAEGL